MLVYASAGGSGWDAAADVSAATLAPTLAPTYSLLFGSDSWGAAAAAAADSSARSDTPGP